ncbi:MAG: peptidylprolyl isomerase [Clostridia bacterium]|nr:peptidylprolyl isomerase [Clostridia bacterium]
MHTNMGDISIRFFPEAAPKAVENFKTHAKNHYYDNLTFHRVIADFMIQGGDPRGNGSGGESIWEKPFEDEFDQKLLNISGALSMANSGVNTNGSQFFINYQSKDKAPKKEDYAANTDAAIRERAAESYYQNYDYIKGQCPTLLDFLKLKYAYPVYDWIPAEVWDVYAENGGSIHLDGAWRYGGGHTVFGQVFEGLDVVEKISKVETDMNDMPVSAVSIKSIEIKAYEG